MKIAVSGTHRTGKSTLVASLQEALPELTTIDEPYDLLLDDGYACAAVPTDRCSASRTGSCSSTVAAACS